MSSTTLPFITNRRVHCLLHNAISSALLLGAIGIYSVQPALAKTPPGDGRTTQDEQHIFLPIVQKLAVVRPIVFTALRDGNEEIYSMNADGSNQTRLTNNDTSDYEPGW